jgi:hypothetical protein
MKRLILVLTIAMAAPAVLFPQIFDFQVNTTAGSIGIQHSSPRLVPRPDGGVLAIWLDQRNGADQVFGRILSADGRTVGKDILISEQPLELDSDQPVGFDAAGRLVMARIENSGNGSQLYARRFSADGAPIGSYFRIDDDPTGAYKSNCILACDSAGGFAAVWSDTRNGRWYDLYLQRFDAEGRPITRNLRINGNAGEANVKASSLALDSQGRCAVVWINGSIYLQQFSSAGSAVGQNIRVAGIGPNVCHPRVCIDGQGNAAVLHYPNTKANFALSRFSENGEPLDRTEFGQLDAAQQDAMIFLRPDGAFLLVWDVWNEEDGSTGLTESALRYRLDSSAEPDIFHVRRVPDDFCSTQDVLLRQDGTSFYSWTGQDQHVYVQCCESTGKTRYGVVKACDDTLGSSCSYPSVGVAPDGGFAVAWVNWGSPVDREIFVRVFDAKGEPRSQDIGTGAYALYPAVTSGPAGDFNVFWKVSGYRVEGRHFNGNAVPGDSILAFSEMATCSIVPRAAANSAGNAVVVWQGDPDFEGEQTDVCGRLCSADGLPLGPVIRVNEFPSEDYSYTQPRVAVAEDGGFMVVWTETDARRMVRARLYNPDGEAMGGSFDVLPFLSDKQWAEEAFVFAESGGGFSVFVFEEQTLRGVRLGPDGSPAGDPKTLIEDEYMAADVVPKDMDRDSDGSFVVALEKNGGIVARVFDPDWSLLGKPFLLTEGAAIVGSISVRMRGGRIYAAWEDRRSPERGSNIWASVTDAATGIRISKTVDPAVISLGANYPNPFNPVTVLSYELSRPAEVTLAVFNAGGRRIRTLESGFAQAGRYESRWDGRNESGLPMPSGMYVFRLTSDGTRLQRKAMLVR